MAEHIKKYAEKKGLSLFRGKPGVYIDDSKVFCFADNSVSPEEIFEEKLIHFPKRDFGLWEGEHVFLVKPFHKEVSYSKVLIDEILELFEKLGYYKSGFCFLPKNKLFVITSKGMWSAIAPRMTEEEDYNMERNAFIERIREIEQGYRFFEINKEDKLALMDTEKIEFEWSKLTDKDFVELCFDIFKSLPQIQEVKITEGTSDLGQDIVAVENVTSLVGEIKQKWTIQCKHFTSRKVAPSDIINIANSYSQLRFDVFCLMTSNFLLPSCHRMLEAWSLPEFHFKAITWDKKNIEDYLRNKPQIYARYFAR